MKEKRMQRETMQKENVQKEIAQEKSMQTEIVQTEMKQEETMQEAGLRQPAFFAQKFHQRQEETEEKKEQEQGREQELKEKRLRVAAYIRVSTDGSSQEDSYETQMRYFTENLMENPAWISAGVYCDYGVSGTSEEKRIGFRRLMRHCEEGRIDRIVSKSVSRFARNTRDFLRALEVLKKNHVSIAFEKEGLDTAVTQNDLFFTAFAAVAQEESRSISSNVSWSIRRRYPKGEARNFVIYGYHYVRGKQAVQVTKSGYRFRQVEAVPEQAAAVRRIFAEIAEGKTYISVARGLNFDRIDAPESTVSGRGNLMAQTPKGKLKSGLQEGWTAAHIRRIVHLERYTGDVKLQKTYKPDYRSRKTLVNHGELPQYYVRNHHPAILDRELFQEVEVVRAAKRKKVETGEGKRQHPFSGKLVCSQCGRFYWTRNRRSRPIWYCASTAQNNGSGICHAERIYEEQLVRVCRAAAIERYELFGGTETQKEGSGSRAGYTVAECKAKDRKLIQNLIQQMEQIQQADEMEQDCLFLKRQISKSQLYAWETEQLLEKLKADRETKQETEEWCEQKIRHVSQELDREKRKIRKLGGQLEHLEQYWMELESDYEWHRQAIVWMRKLPDGHSGIAGFLEGLGSGYVRAFILTMEIVSPFLYRVHWFDDVWTEVRMYSNVARGNWNEEACLRMQDYEMLYAGGKEKDKGYE